MPDVFLYQGQVTSTDIKLRDPTRVAVDNPVSGATTFTATLSCSDLVKRVVDGAVTTTVSPVATDAVKRTVAGASIEVTTLAAADAVKRTVDGSSTGTVALAATDAIKRVETGSSTGSATPVAAETVKRVVDGSATGAASPTAAEAVKRTVTGSALTSTTPTATESVKRTVAGAATSSAVPSATDAVKRAIDGSATGTAAPAATDAVKRVIDGSATETTTPVATEIVKRAVVGATTGSAALSITDGVKRTVDGSSTGSVALSGIDTVKRVESGSATSTASPVGSDAVKRVVDGSVSTTATPSAQEVISRTVSGSVNTSTSLSGSDIVNRLIEGSVDSTATPSGSNNVARASSGAANASSIPAGSDNVARSLVGSSNQSISLSNTDAVNRALLGSSTADASAEATFTEPAALDLDGGSFASASVEASITPDINASGGTLVWSAGTFQGLKIQVPAGALATNTNLTPSTRAGFEGYNSVGPNVQFEHVEFAIPVLLTIPVVVPPTHSLRHVKVIKTDASGFTRARKPTSVDEDAQTVTLEVDSFSGFGGVIPAHDHVFVCNTSKVLKATVGGSDTKFFQKCQCGCWLALVYVVAYPNSGGVDGGGNFSCACSIRSSAPNGVMFDLPIHHLIYSDNAGGPTFTTNFEIGLEVGRDTNGVWESLGSKVENGITFHAWINAYKPRTGDNAYDRPMGHRCDPPFYSPPLFATASTDPAICRSERSNPGPIKWRDLASLVNSALGPFTYDGGHCIDPGESEGPEDDINYFTPGWHNAIPEGGAGQEMWQSFCHSLDDGLIEGKWQGSFHALTDPSGGTCLLVATYPPGFETHYVFPKAVFSFPTAPISVDDSFDLNVTFVNPFTGSPIDGTHVFDDINEDDIDAVPKLGIEDLGPGDSMYQGTSIVRNGYANYTIFGAKIRARKGQRVFNVFADHEFGSFLFIPKYAIDSARFTLTCGVAAYIDLVPVSPQGSPTFGSVKYQIGALIDDTLGGPIVSRILDYLGQFLTYNVVDGATDSVIISLINGAGNAIASPMLNGTTTKAAVNGFVNYDDLTAYALGKHYSLRVTSSGSLGQSHSDNWYEHDVEFWIGLRFQTPPTINAGINFDIKVDLVDATGTIVTPSTVDSVTISGAGSFTGFGSTTPSGGTAAFNGNFPVAGTYTVQVVTSGTHYDGPPVTVTMDFVVLP